LHDKGLKEIMKLIDYIQGKRRGQEANKLEREAMNDPFLQDAIDGFDAVRDDHVQAIHDLEDRLDQKASKRKRLISYRVWVFGAAASVALMLGIGSLFHFSMKQPENTAVVASKPIVLPIIDTIEHLNEPTKQLLAQHQQKRVQKSVSKYNVQLVSPEQIDDTKTVELLEENKNPIGVADVAPEHDVADVMSFREAVSGKVNGVEVTSGNILNNRNMSSATSSLMLAEVNRSPNIITGKVVDADGEPLIGATVRVKGENNGTVTNVDGKFELPKPQSTNDRLIASYIGFENEEIPATDNSYVIKLKPSSLAMSEVVVVGYGQQRKSAVVGSVVSTETSTKQFGESEFRKYYQTHHKADLCNLKNYVVRAKFQIDNLGNPIQIEVTQSPCDEIMKEFIMLLQSSPKWTKHNSKVNLSIRM
jgi:hypothetical protein